MQTDVHSPLSEVTRADRVLLRLLQVGGIILILVVAPLEGVDLDRFLVPKELVVHVLAGLAGLLTLRHRHRIQITWIDALLVTFLVISALSAIQATNPWLALRSLTLSASGVVLFWAARSLPSSLKPALWASLALVTVVAVFGALLQAYGVESPLFTDKRIPGGTLGNRNFVGHWAVFGLPMLLLVALRTDRTSRFLLAASCVPLLAAAWVLTRSRAAWVGVFVVLCVLGVGFLVRSVLRDGKRLRRLLIMLTLAAGCMIAAAYLPNALRWTSDSPYLETARDVVNYQEGSGSGRLVQYRTTLKLAAAHPLLGVGPGNWAVSYLDVAAPNDPSRNWSQPGTTANPWPSSDWVALVSERGFPALLLVILIGLGLSLRAARTLFKAREAETGLVALTVLAILAGVTVVGAFDAVLLLPWPVFFVSLALGALDTNQTEPLPSRPARFPASVLLIVTLMAGLGAVYSTGQLAALTLYESDTEVQTLTWASRLDPGSYRVHLRLAQRYTRNREARCRHAQAAQALYPHAQAAKRLARRCP